MRSADHVLQLILHLSIVRTAINVCLQKMQVSATRTVRQDKTNAIFSSHDFLAYKDLQKFSQPSKFMFVCLKKEHLAF